MQNIIFELPSSIKDGSPIKKYGIMVILAAVIFLVGYFIIYPTVKPVPTPEIIRQKIVPVSEGVAPETKASLGGEIFDKANNPIKGKVPESAPAVKSPIGDVYKNPFK